MGDRFSSGRKELNQFLIIYLVFTSIGSVTKSISDGLGFLRLLEQGSEYLAYILIVATVINAFVIIYFIVYKKDILGVWLFYGLIFIEFVLLLSLYGEVTHMAFIWAISRAVLFSLILFLRRNGESAWKTLNRKETQVIHSNEVDEEEFNPIWKYITYALTGMVVVVMIIAIIIQFR